MKRDENEMSRNQTEKKSNGSKEKSKESNRANLILNGKSSTKLASRLPDGSFDAQ